MKAQPPQPQNPLAALDQHRATLHGQFQKLQQAQIKGTAMEAALQKLEQLGEAVTTSDVVKEIGKLVGNGMVDARTVAVSLTDMPQSGPALAEWVSQHLQQGAMVLQHVQVLKDEAQRQLLNASFTGFMAHAGAAARAPQAQALAQAQPEPEQQPSALTPGSPVAGAA